MKLTEEEISFYRKNGYISVNGVFDKDEIDRLRTTTDEFVEKSRLVTSNTNVLDLEPGHTAENPRLRRLRSPAEHHPVYDAAIRQSRMLNLVAQLIGSEIRTNGNKLNMKSAGYGSPVEWHQDWAFYPHTNDDLLAVGIALDDIKIENGPLLVVPGSHRGPIYDHHQNGVFVGAISSDIPGIDKAVPIELPAGGISLHHVRLIHGSATNASSRSRRLLLFQFCAADAWPLLGVKNWDSFNDDLLRGTPPQTPRLTDVPVRIPLPKIKGSIYELQEQLRKV